MQGGIDGREHPGHAVADQAHLFDPGVILDPANRIRDEVEYVILDPQTAFRSGRRIPVHHVDVKTATDKELDQALPLRQIEDRSRVRRWRNQQHGNPIDLLRARVVAIQRQRAAPVQQGTRRHARSRARGSDVLEAVEAALHQLVDFRAQAFDERGIGHFAITERRHRSPPPSS
ncbi:hypothetical protein FQZ97_916040 [compost metagenome]